MAFERRLGLSLAGILFSSAVARAAFILLNFDRDWEYDAYAHVIAAKSIYAHFPDSLWEAASWWAKPLYTLFFGSLYQLLSPDWPGLVVAQTANIVFWLAASCLTLLVAREIFRHPLTPVVLAVICGFSFVAFRSSVSANTEPIGAFALALGLYCWHRRRWSAASLCFGLVPLTRTDGIICVAIFGLAAMLDAWRAQRWHGIVPAFLRSAFLILPTLLWHLANFIHTGNLLFIETHGNLGIAAGAMGFGQPWDYIVTFLAFDAVLFLSFVTGAVLVLARPRQAGEMLVVSTLIALAYFAAMTVLWTWGLYGAAGYIRYFVFAYPLYILVGGAAIDHLLSGLAHSKRLSAEKAAAGLSLAVVLGLHWFAHGIVWINHNSSLPPNSELRRLPDLPVAWDHKTIYADYPEVVYYLCRGHRYCDYSPLTEIANPSARGFFIYGKRFSEFYSPGVSLSSFDGLVLYGTLEGPYRDVIFIFER